MIDYLIIGAGLYGATFARSMTDIGKRCLIIDKRDHIGGNVYTEKLKGIHVHKYGPHIFHTNSEKIWKYVNQFAEFNPYTHKVLSQYNGTYYSFPINLKTFEQLWGNLDDQSLINKFLSTQREHKKVENLEEWAIAELGEEIYYKFIYGYTKKQWGTEPNNLPSSIIKRLPVRTERNDDYHKSIFTGIPKNGYTDMINNMLDGIDIEINVDYLKKRYYWDSISKFIVYTGAIDEFFEYTYGPLVWRSLYFEEKIINKKKYQDVAQINYMDQDIQYTRSIEHKHFTPYKPYINNPYTIVTFEYPQAYDINKERFYPVNDSTNNALYSKYKKLIPSRFIFGGRLATYKYYDMHQVIGSALSKSSKKI